MANSSTRSSARSSADKVAESAHLLDSAFFRRHTVEVARELLGKVLVVRSTRGAFARAVRIVETEAYRAGDPASHSARGITPRCAVMFGPPGVSYVYLIYGMYSMLNFVTEPEGDPGAVLVRAVEPLGLEGLGKAKSLTNGPGKLTRHLGITLRDDGLLLQGPRLWVGDDGFEAGNVLCSSRVGISAAKDRPWRFFLEANPHVSRVAENRGAVRVKDQG
jgi:DNA-3-methyladenine glycosylase